MLFFSTSQGQQADEVLHFNSKAKANVSIRYIPVVAAVMFWPYAVQPIMDWKEGVHKA